MKMIYFLKKIEHVNLRTKLHTFFQTKLTIFGVSYLLRCHSRILTWCLMCF